MPNEMTPVGTAIGEAVGRTLVPFVVNERIVGEMSATIKGLERQQDMHRDTVEKYDREAKDRDKGMQEEIDEINKETMPAVWEEINSKASNDRVRELEKEVAEQKAFKAKVAIFGTILAILVPALMNLAIKVFF